MARDRKMKHHTAVCANRKLTLEEESLTHISEALSVPVIDTAKQSTVVCVVDILGL